MLEFNKNIKIGNRMIGSDYPTYFIAEIGGNFDGSIDKAKKLIDAGKEATVEADMEQWTGSKLGKEYRKAVYLHPVH